MFNKLALWGTKKEYPTIISLIIAVFIPAVGLIFVGNQLRFKSDEMVRLVAYLPWHSYYH